jgi:hypothetical protein
VVSVSNGDELEYDGVSLFRFAEMPKRARGWLSADVRRGFPFVMHVDPFGLLRFGLPLFRVWPITSVSTHSKPCTTARDWTRRVHRTRNPLVALWFRGDVGWPQAARLRAVVFDRLTGYIVRSEPDNLGRVWASYPTVEDAHKAESRACVALGRELAELPQIEVGDE